MVYGAWVRRSAHDSFNRETCEGFKGIKCVFYVTEHRIIKRLNQLRASLLASFPCNLNTFRKRAKNVVISKGIQVGIECK
jgi:hypothetical protein